MCFGFAKALLPPKVPKTAADCDAVPTGQKSNRRRLRWLGAPPCCLWLFVPALRCICHRQRFCFVTYAEYEQAGLVLCGAFACRLARTAPSRLVKNNRRNIIVYQEGYYPSITPPRKIITTKKTVLLHGLIFWLNFIPSQVPEHLSQDLTGSGFRLE